METLYVPAAGISQMKEGDNRVMFKLVGRNEKSKGHGLDLYRIIFEKIR